MRTALVPAAALLAAIASAPAAAPASASVPGSAPASYAAGLTLPERMTDTGGGSQLITAQAPRTGATEGRVTWWDRRHGRWVKAGSAAARFGAGGLVDGAKRKQGTSTTPTGLYDLPYAFGTAPAPGGTRTGYRRVTSASWWCQDNDSRAYNRWVEGLPSDCRADESERMASYRKQYGHGLVIGYNYDRPVRGRGAGIFLHVNGKGPTAGCVSVPSGAMRRILVWADPRRAPHIAIGTPSGPTAITAVTS
ncbi:L,D-transpeptidase family protein [Streptomyces sp. NPDC050804]|uniref:L,D-transpeptidase family protein n=1 Tax=Streptomyces sp. NPDC050804 TaxID=3154745 RepID=UPI0034135D84